ncbi:hypothetical protein JCM12296A_59970 [Desulfosarcina cetonica]
MQIHEARLLLKSKSIHSPRILLKEEGWILEFDSIQETPLLLHIESQRGGTIYYKSVRGVVNACIKIGFDTVAIELPKDVVVL